MMTGELLNGIADVLDANDVGPEIRKALGLLVTGIVLPVLTNVISEDLKERRKHRS